MLILNICSVRVWTFAVSMYSFRTLLRTFAIYLWYNLFF